MTKPLIHLLSPPQTFPAWSVLRYCTSTIFILTVTNNNSHPGWLVLFHTAVNRREETGLVFEGCFGEKRRANNETETDSETLVREKGGKQEEWKNSGRRKSIKPDWECLPRVVLVTLNYKCSLTFPAKTHNHNIIPMMHFHWQATLLFPGLALTTNLCPLLSLSFTPSFHSPEWGFF